MYVGLWGDYWCEVRSDDQDNEEQMWTFRICRVRPMLANAQRGINYIQHASILYIALQSTDSEDQLLRLHPFLQATRFLSLKSHSTASLKGRLIRSTVKTIYLYWSELVTILMTHFSGVATQSCILGPELVGFTSHNFYLPFHRSSGINDSPPFFTVKLRCRRQKPCCRTTFFLYFRYDLKK